MINQVANISHPRALKPTCDNAQDNYTEFECPAGVKVFNPTNPRDGIGLPMCIEMTKHKFETVMARYQNSDVSCNLLRARYSLYRRYYERLTGANGVIEKLRFYLLELHSMEQIAKLNTRNLIPVL